MSSTDKGVALEEDPWYRNPHAPKKNTRRGPKRPMIAKPQGTPPALRRPRSHQPLPRRPPPGASPQQIRQAIHIRTRHQVGAIAQKLLLSTHTREHTKRPTQPRLHPKPYIRIQAIAHHTRARARKAHPPLDRIHHRRRGLAERQRRAPARDDERGAEGAGAGEQRPRGRQRRVGVGREEGGAAAQVRVRDRVLEVAGVEVQGRQHDGYVRVEQGGVGGGEGGEVGGRGGAAERGVGAADVRDAGGGELVLDARLAEDEDFVVRRGEAQDARDVDGGAVAGAEDFVLAGSAGGGGEGGAVGAGPLSRALTSCASMPIWSNLSL